MIHAIGKHGSLKVKRKLELKPSRSTVQGKEVAESVQSREAEEKSLSMLVYDIS
jgi:hypothetical protein